MSLSISLSTVCMPRSLTKRTSSNTNMSLLMFSTRSGLSTSMPSMIVRSVFRSQRLSTSATALTPPTRSDELEHVRQAILETRFHLLDEIWVRLLHVGDPTDDLDLLVGWQTDENLGGPILIQMTGDQGDRLRMLLLDESQKSVGLDATEKTERCSLNLVFDLVHDQFGTLTVEGFVQQSSCIVESTFTDIATGQLQTVVLLDHLLREGRGDVLYGCYDRCHSPHDFGGFPSIEDAVCSSRLNRSTAALTDLQGRSRDQAVSVRVEMHQLSVLVHRLSTEADSSGRDWTASRI